MSREWQSLAMETPARIPDNDDDDNGMAMGSFMSSEEMFINDRDDDDDDYDAQWKDIQELIQYDKLKYETFIADAEAESKRRACEDESYGQYDKDGKIVGALAGTGDRRCDLDLSYVNYGKGKYGECPLYPGKDVNYVMVDHRYPQFKYRPMSFYIGSLYGFQDRINEFTRPQFIGRRYNVNGMNSLDPLYYQSLTKSYDDVHLPLAAMKMKHFSNSLSANNCHFDVFGDQCNVEFWKCELDDRVYKTMPRMEKEYLCVAHNPTEDFGKLSCHGHEEDGDKAVLDYLEHHHMDGVKHFEDGGRCTKWKSPGHVWLEVPPDDVIVEFGGSDRPFILDQTFCLTRPLRRRLVEDNKMSTFEKPPSCSSSKEAPVILPWQPLYDKTGGNDNLNARMHQIKSKVSSVTTSSTIKENLMTSRDLNSKECKEQLSKHKLNGFFAHSNMVDDDEDARPVVMGEDDHEWQCTKLIHRQQWKDVIQEELNDFRLFMKYAYGSDVEEDHFHQELGSRFDDDIHDKEKKLPATMRNSIIRRKVQCDVEHGSEDQSDWDVMPELLERSDFSEGWGVNKDLLFDGDENMLLTDDFKGQWEIIWQDWSTNPLTKHAVEDKKRKVDLKNRYDDLWDHWWQKNEDGEHMKKCGMLNWVCDHARTAMELWEKEKEHMSISRGIRFHEPQHGLVEGDGETMEVGGNSHFFLKDGQKEKVDVVNKRLKELKSNQEGGSLDYGRRISSRWTTYEEARHYEERSRKRLMDESFHCIEEGCVKSAKFEEERRGFFQGHSEKCDENRYEVMESEMEYKMIIQGNHEKFREQYREDMNRLIQAKNIWGTLWAFELNRMQVEDIRSYAYQCGILSCDWLSDVKENANPLGLLLDEGFSAASDSLRQRFVDNALKRMEGQMDDMVASVNGELLRRGVNGSKNLRIRRMSLQSFHSLIRSSESMNDRYQWQEQLIKIYDVKHSWLKAELSKDIQDLIDADCPLFSPDETAACTYCHRGTFVYNDDGEYTYAHVPKPCIENECAMCQTSSAKENRNKWHGRDEGGEFDWQSIYPGEGQLVRPYNRNTQLFIPGLQRSGNESGICRHDRFTRCGCYRDYSWNRNLKRGEVNDETRPMVLLHNYNFDGNMNFQSYSSTVGLGNGPVVFSGELFRPYTIDPSLEVEMIKDKLDGGSPHRWGEVTFDQDLLGAWDPRVNWEAEGPRLRGFNLNWIRPPNEVYLPNTTRYRYRQGRLNENVRRGNVYMDFPRWKDNPSLLINDHNDTDDDDDNIMPKSIKWLDNGKTCAVITGQMDLLDPLTTLLDHSLANNGNVRRLARDMLNAYNPAVHGVQTLLRYLASMTSQLREILAINATFRNHFAMPIKQMYHGALHQGAKIMRHYAQMSNPTTAIYVENHQRGIAAIQRHNFLKEHDAFERLLRKEIRDGAAAGTSLIDIFKCRTVNYLIIQHLLYCLEMEMKKMNDACYAMPNHPSCQIIRRKETLNTERLILHIAYINYEDIEYFRKCYARIYRCKCFL